MHLLQYRKGGAVPAMPTRSDSDSQESEVSRLTFPHWLKELIYVGGFIVALTIFGQNLKSDQRSTREELGRVSEDIASTKTDVNAIRAMLPNKEVIDLRLKDLDDKIGRLRADLEFEQAKAQSFRESLLKKGVLE